MFRHNVKKKTGLVPRRGTSPVLSSDFLYGPLELHKQQYQTDAQQDVADSGMPEMAALMPEERVVPSTWVTPRMTSITAVRFRPT